MLSRQEREWAVQDYFQYADALLPSAHMYWEADDKVAVRHREELLLEWAKVDSRWEAEADCNEVQATRGLEESRSLRWKKDRFGSENNAAIQMRWWDQSEEYISEMSRSIIDSLRVAQAA